MKKNVNSYMRLWHRNLGYFLAGIMAMYAISGTVLVFRKTNFLKQNKVVESLIDKNLNAEELGKAIKKNGLKAKSLDGKLVYEGGAYDPATGQVSYTKKELPYILDKMTSLHKATTKSRFYVLNLFFGFSLLFFVVSSFWMYTPKMPVFKKGMYFALAGLALVLFLIFV